MAPRLGGFSGTNKLLQIGQTKRKMKFVSCKKVYRFDSL